MKFYPQAVFGRDPKLFKILDDPELQTKEQLYTRLGPFLSETWRQENSSKL